MTSLSGPAGAFLTPDCEGERRSSELAVTIQEICLSGSDFWRHCFVSQSRGGAFPFDKGVSYLCVYVLWGGGGGGL